MNRQDIQKVDAHTHLFYDRDFLLPLLKQWRMKAVVINITGKKAFQEPMQQRWAAMVEMQRAHPNRIALCTTFDPEPIAEPDFAEKTVEELRRHVQQGAAMVKVWKDIGLELKDRDGSYVQIDDSRFQPIWDYLAEAGVPLLAHIAEPKAAWQPLDERTPHYKYYRDHPQYHFYHQPEAPRWETIIQARDRWIERNPALTIVGAHLGSMAHDVGEVAQRLDRYPNFYVDTAERFADLVIQESDAVRAFFMRFQDRILYGTDVIFEHAATDMSEAQQQSQQRAYQALLESHWHYLTGTEEMEMTDNKFIEPVHVQPLNLPRQVVEKVYMKNAERLIDW